MRIPDVTSVRPTLVSHVYWKEKAAFQLSEDTNEFWVIFAVEKGSFIYKIGTHEGTASFGDLVLCPPGVIFRREVVQPLSFHVFLLQWIDEEKRPLPNEDGIPIGKITIQDLKRLSSSYAYLKKWVELSGHASSMVRHHLVTDIWMQVVEEKHTASSEPFSQMVPGSAGGKDSLIQKAAQIMQEQAIATFSLKRLAMELGLTQVQFTRRFKKSTGMLPLDYLTSLRLQKVQKLLLDSELTLQQIAGQCGFENEFYLSRVFKKKMKITPSHYRKLHRL